MAYPQGEKMILVQYVRDNKRRPIGVVAAVGKNQVGWSKCSKKDQFSKKIGCDMAIGRAKTRLVQSTIIPQSVTKDVEKMLLRAEHYYKEVSQ